jgi:hypothetical protein
MRQHVRFRLEDAVVKLYNKGFFTSIGLGRSTKDCPAVNLSEGGVLILSPKKLEVGAKVQVRIEMEKYGEAIESPGEIRWWGQSVKGSGEYYLGIMFTGIQPADVKKIAKMREWFTSPEYKTRTARRLKAPQK